MMETGILVAALLGGFLSGLFFQLASKYFWFMRVRNHELSRIRDLKAALEKRAAETPEPKPSRNEYFPDEVSSPGSILADLLGEQGIAEKGAAIRLGWTMEHLVGVLQGKEELTPEMCTSLGKVFKTPPRLWQNLEDAYRNPPAPDAQELADKCLQICKNEGWPLDWSGRGCYIHLEVSEFVEAMRGKGDTSVTEEGADVLFTVFSALAVEGIPISDVLRALSKICDGYLEKD